MISGADVREKVNVRAAVASSHFGRFLLIPESGTETSSAIARVAILNRRCKALYLVSEHGSLLAGSELNDILAGHPVGEVVDVTIERRHSIPAAQTETPTMEDAGSVLSEAQVRHAALFVREAASDLIKDQRLAILAQVTSSAVNDD